MFGRVALAIVALAFLPGSAMAVPPVNDNYLSSTTINRADGTLPRQYADRQDIREASTQTDLFNPNRDGLPFGGGAAERTDCDGVPTFGRTVWYDFAPPVGGGARITASGYDAVIVVYGWDLETSSITSMVTCQSASSGLAEEVLLPPERLQGRNYTIQVGAVAAAVGTLEFGFEFFPDHDRDGVLDEQPDECRSLPGIPAFGGCPPLVPGSPTLSFSRTATGIVVDRLLVARTPRGARIRVRCRRCGRAVSLRQTRRRAPVRVRGFAGRSVGAGDRLEVRITRSRTQEGRYRFGAIGKRLWWDVVAGGIEPLQSSCTRPGSNRRIACP